VSIKSHRTYMNLTDAADGSSRPIEIERRPGHPGFKRLLKAERVV
jgi:hypothetical protein